MRYQFFTSGGPSIGASGLALALPNEYLVLISFRIDWFDLAAQETVKSLLQYHSSKASVLQSSLFFMVQLSLPYYQFSSVAQSCLTLCDHMDCSTPGFPVHHQLLELAQTHLYRVGDAIQPSHPLSSPSPAFNLSQHQGLF